MMLQRRASRLAMGSGLLLLAGAAAEAGAGAAPWATLPAQAPLKLDDLRTPTSPGFVLLGVEPTAVERPSDPKAIAVSLLSATQSGDLIPRNYAIEVAPYWLTGHPTLTFDGYYKAKLGQTLLQTLSISLATSKDSTAIDSVASGTRIGVGVRTLLVAGRANPALAEKVAQLRGLQDSVLATDSPEVEDSLTKRLQQIALAIQGLDKERVGWRVEMAGGLAAAFPEDNFSRLVVSRIGVWVTPSYRPVGDSLDFIGVGRFIRALNDSVNATLLDLGGRVRWQTGRVLLSTEFVHRTRTGTSGPGGSSVRLVGDLEYRVSDQMAITASFGKNYDQGVRTGQTLVSIIGVNFGLGPVPGLCLSTTCAKPQ